MSSAIFPSTAIKFSAVEIPPFDVFSRAVHKQFTEMSKRELFTVPIADAFEHYLRAFPPFTNPTYRVRTVHDCQCCKQFIRRLGCLVNLVDGEVVTVWDNLDLPEPYRTVATAMGHYVRSHPIETVFRTKERQYGTEYNFDTKTNDRHDHFYGEVEDKHFVAKDPDTKRGEREAVFQVMQRGLKEIKADDLATVIDLIESNALYRGEEHKEAVIGFRDLQQRQLASNDLTKFVWEHLDDRYARFRNTVIGTLLTDLAEGKDLEHAVKAFETKVAPANYKRPTAVITQKMIDQAVETINALDLGGAIYRRYARLSDVSVNDVLFVDKSSRGKMKDGVAALLADSAKPQPIDVKKAIPITATEFVQTILSTTTTLGLFLENRHTGNFVSLTGGDGPERLFKWNNNFAWSYAGELADSDLRRRVQALGGRVDGVLRFSHTWNYDKRNASLMDLHVFMPGSSKHEDGCHDRYPSGQRVGWNQRSDSVSGGVQDVDYVQAAPEGYVPVENTTFPSLDRLKEGTYVFKIHNWQFREPTRGGFRAEIECGGQVYQYEMDKSLKQKEWVTVATATLKNGVFTVNHVLPCGTSSQEKWGVKTETVVPVTSVMNSPNHWGDQAVGAKHLIFALEGCKNPEGTRGIYNEFLRGDLDKHRKVFETLAAKTKVKPADDQISGVGFTQARGDSVTVVVNGKRSYTISF